VILIGIRFAATVITGWPITNKISVKIIIYDWWLEWKQQLHQS